MLRRSRTTRARTFPLRQSLSVFQQFATMTIVVRGTNTRSLERDVQSVVRSLNGELAPFNVRTLEAEVASLVAAPRFSATVLLLFATVALSMAALGVYGVTTFVAARRTHEIGVRMALGATRGRILTLVLRDGLLVVALGLGSGLVAAIWLAQALAGLQQDVAAVDAPVLGAVAVVLSLTGLVAVAVPATRATRLSAMRALRED